MGLFGSSGDVNNADLDCTPQGEYVTEARVAKLDEILDPGEKVHYLTKGANVKEEGSGSGLMGSNEETSSGTKGRVRAAFTDERVAVKVPQLMGDDERSVPYDSVTSVDLDTGLVNNYVSLQTPGQTYKVHANEPGKDELRAITKFVREKVTEADEPAVVEGSEPDPTEQLQRLKELNDDGVITDEEFEEKKASLMDKI